MATKQTTKLLKEDRNFRIGRLLGIQEAVAVLTRDHGVKLTHHQLRGLGKTLDVPALMLLFNMCTEHGRAMLFEDYDRLREFLRSEGLDATTRDWLNVRQEEED